MPMSLFLATNNVDRDVVPFALVSHRTREGGTILGDVCHGMPCVQHKRPCQLALTILKRSATGTKLSWCRHMRKGARHEISQDKAAAPVHAFDVNQNKQKSYMSV